MLFTVQSKTDLKGEKVFFPNAFAHSVQVRNKIRRFAGYYGREEEPGMWRFLCALWVGLFTFIGGALMNNGYVAVGALGVIVLMIFGAVIAGIIMNSRKPKPPNVPLVRQHDVRWSFLTVAFKDDRELWERMMDDITVDKYWSLKYQRELTKPIAGVVSEYMTVSDPHLDVQAWSVRREVERIYAEYDRNQAEARALREAEAEVKAAEDQWLFEQKVRMAEQDVATYGTAVAFLNH